MDSLPCNVVILPNNALASKAIIASQKLAPASIAVFSGAFPKLGLFAMGDNGTCIRLISEFNFSQDENTRD